MPVTTIVASLDDSSVKALYCERAVEEVIAELEAGKFVEVEGDIGPLFVSSSSVKYVQAGRKQLPVSALPSSNSRSEHQAFVSSPAG